MIEVGGHYPVVVGNTITPQFGEVRVSWIEPGRNLVWITHPRLLGPLPVERSLSSFQDLVDYSVAYRARHNLQKFDH